MRASQVQGDPDVPLLKLLILCGIYDISVSFSLSLFLPLSIASASVHICSLGASPGERQLHLPSSPPHSICDFSFSLSQVIQCNQVAIMKRPEDVAGTGYVTSTQWWVEWCQVKAKAGRTHISLNYESYLWFIVATLGMTPCSKMHLIPGPCMSCSCMSCV